MHEARLMPVLTARFLEEISFNGGFLSLAAYGEEPVHPP